MMTGLAAAGLMLLAASAFWRDQPEAPATRAQPAPLATALPLPARPPAPRPATSVVATRLAQRCETSQISGSHTARAEWEARQGALEDATDICPAGKVIPAQVSCAPVAGGEGNMGYAAIKCVQQAACTLCGDGLARMREVAQSSIHAAREFAY